MLDDPKSFTGSKTAGQSPNAGWFNRFVQTGKSDHETKTNGCFGGRLHRCPITHLHPSHVCYFRFRLSCARFYISGDVVYYPIMQLVSGWGVWTRFIYIYIYIYIYASHAPQDSKYRWLAAQSPVTFIQLHASNGCRVSGVILAAWRRSPQLHGYPFMSCVSARTCTAPHQ